MDGLLIISLKCLVEDVFESCLHLLDVMLEHVLDARLEGSLSYVCVII